MNMMELESIFDDILNRSEKLIQNERRDDILNERFFHHMFSTLVASYFSEKGIDVWKSLLLVPEFPTKKKFSWKYLKLSDVEHTREYGMDKGKQGNFDFAIRTKPQENPSIFIEWKGPKLYEAKDIAEVTLKLLSQSDSDSKVFVAIITSSITGRRDHLDAISEHLRDGIKFSVEVLVLSLIR